MGRLLEGFFCALLGQQIEQETDRGFNNKNIIKCYNFSRDFFFYPQLLVQQATVS